MYVYHITGLQVDDGAPQETKGSHGAGSEVFPQTDSPGSPLPSH